MILFYMMKKKFVEKEIDKIANVFQLPKEYINICNFREGSTKFDVHISEKLVEGFIKDYNKQKEKMKPYVDPFLNTDEDFQNLVNKLIKVSNSNNTQITKAPLVEAIKLNTSMFDSRNNRSSGWGEGE